jgi:hypothetical protein
MSDHVADPVERRLRRLERDWRVFRAAAAVVVVAIVATATSAFRRHEVPSLRTDRLELIDQMGRVRATLSVGRDAAAWTVVDSTGRAVAALTLEETGQIAVRDAEGRVQATLGPATVHHLTER